MVLLLALALGVVLLLALALGTAALGRSVHALLVGAESLLALALGAEARTRGTRALLVGRPHIADAAAILLMVEIETAGLQGAPGMHLCRNLALNKVRQTGLHVAEAELHRR